MMISSIIFIIFASLWTCHDAASDTLKPGDTLNSSSSLVSASGKFSLYFYVYNDGSNNNSYLAILNKEAPNNVWIGNRDTPIVYPSSAVLTLDWNNTLKLTHQGGDPIVISSAPQTSNISTSVVATLLDSGNFILQEVNSTDGSTKQVWWQSFDYPFDTFLPGMKLGINHKSGHLWSMSSWATYNNPMPGPFTLDWDPNGHQLQIRRQGVLYWTSGVFTSSSKTFEFISAEESKLRYNFSVVSNDKEDYFTYTAVDHDQSDQEPQWVLTFMGRFHDGSFNFTQADNCDGYNTGGGCVRRDRPSDCMAKFNDEFELKNGYFKINNSSNSSRSPSWFGTSSSDCKATCWQNCDCLGFDVPLANGTSTGCRFWSVDCQFFEDLTASNSFVLSGHATPAKSPSAKKNDSIRGVLLDWKKRFNIIEGITQGLLYLHKYSRTRVIHRDLKASNILLDENMNPKISDFGMARIFSHDELEENTSRIVGTRGYMPPESVEGIVSVKFDVYSFGVLMLEIISGRKNNSFYNDDRALNLVGYAWELWKQGSGLELMDQMVGDSSCIEDQLLRCIHVGLLCVEEDAADRPTMSDVISMLTNENPPLALPTKPAFFVGRKLVEAGIGEKQHEITSVNDLSISNFDAR
ncbi:PREDICTED: G-type lectin S-receptor [Prunus dulcis]|uniref:non-specific serine/threonine protein kinase n=1 Tax=Prunus dulcis TaxID=3755 RepID=A0A5E4FKZ3_PRUDU|nr:PREDICTED: G-type lectin S-receptor [Prunus dulcis]